MSNNRSGNPIIFILIVGIIGFFIYKYFQNKKQKQICQKNFSNQNEKNNLTRIEKIERNENSMAFWTADQINGFEKIV